VARRVHRVVDAAQVPRGRLAPLVGLVLVGLALRVVPLLNDPLHQDEALYGYWGRLVSSGQDPWLATVAVDKPPLALYLIAGSQAVFGASRFAIRLPALAASLLAIPLTYALGRRLYGRRSVGWVAAAVMALTPFPVLFGATAFTDALLVLFWLAACVTAVGGRWGSAGALLGLAFATKQQALVLGLLAVGLGVASPWHCPPGQVGGGRGARGEWRTGVRFVLGLAAVVVGVWAWNWFRVVNKAATGFWDQGVDSYGGLRLIWSSELAARGREWARLSGYLLGWHWLGTVFLIGLAALLVHDLSRGRRTGPALMDVALIAFGMFYALLHWLAAFPVWDRYLLPLAPVVGLLLGRVSESASRRIGEGISRFTFHELRITFYILLVLVLFSSGVLAAVGQIPVGGDHGAYAGLEQVVAFLRDLPVGTVLYDRWLSWHYDFYLFDAYLYRAGFPTPEWLAMDAAAHFDGRPRYVVVPGWESAARLTRALVVEGLGMFPVLTTQRRDGTSSFTVYAIERND